MGHKSRGAGRVTGDGVLNRLRTGTLSAIAADVARPPYDRARVTPGIVHLGVGAFHRAHQAAYIDACLAAGETEWGIVAASLRSPETRDALAPQDGLYTLVLRDTDSEQLRIIGAITQVIVAPEQPQRLLDAMSDPRIRIVTLTITEKGYTVDLASGALKTDHPDIVHDLSHPGRPRTALGFLAGALRLRRAAGAEPFTILSCDNLLSNGRTLHRVLTEFARLRDPDLGAYVAAHVACPCSMVDRIVPATTDADRAATRASLGVDDAWPVIGEPFTQWVVEDRFPAGRPRLEAVGVELVDDVEPYEQMKLRLLNGAHTALAAVGRLAGLTTVADAVRHPSIRAFLELYWAEVIPTLGMDPERAQTYTRALLHRFENTALRHLTAQIAGDGSQKLPIRILAPLRELRARGAPRDAVLFAVAAWIRSCGGTDDHGQPLGLNDPVFQAWSGQPDQARSTPAEVVEAFLGVSAIFGPDLRSDAGVVQRLTELFGEIVRSGVVDALNRAGGFGRIGEDPR